MLLVLQRSQITFQRVSIFYQDTNYWPNMINVDHNYTTTRGLGVNARRSEPVVNNVSNTLSEALVMQ